MRTLQRRMCNGNWAEAVSSHWVWCGAVRSHWGLLGNDEPLLWLDVLAQWFRSLYVALQRLLLLSFCDKWSHQWIGPLLITSSIRMECWMAVVSRLGGAAWQVNTAHRWCDFKRGWGELYDEHLMWPEWKNGWWRWWSAVMNGCVVGFALEGVFRVR